MARVRIQNPLEIVSPYAPAATPQAVNMEPMELTGEVPRETPLQLTPPQMPVSAPAQQLPSGEVSPEDMAQIQKRLIDINALQNLSGLGAGIANVLKPGSGNGILDMQAKQADQSRQLAKMPIAQAAQARSRAMQDQEYQRKVAEDQEDRENKHLQAQKIREFIMPGTETAKRYADNLKQKYAMLSQSPGIPAELAKTFAMKAESADYVNRSAQDLEKASADLDSIYGNIAKGAQVQADQGMKQAMLQNTQANQQIQHQLGYAQLGEQRREHDLQHQDRQSAQAEKKAKAEITVRKAQEKLNGQINDLDQADKQLSDVEKFKGSVNTGPITDKLAKVGEMFDLTSHDRNTMKQKLSSVVNNELHKLSGAAVSPSEWDRLQAQFPLMSDDDNVFADKITSLRQQIKELKGRRTEEYQRARDDNMPIDQSVTAQKSAGGTHPNSDPPGTKRKQGGKTYEKQADGSWKEVP